MDSNHRYRIRNNPFGYPVRSRNSPSATKTGSFVPGPMVRIHFPPAERVLCEPDFLESGARPRRPEWQISRESWFEACPFFLLESLKCRPSHGGPMVRIHLPPRESLRTIGPPARALREFASTPDPSEPGHGSQDHHVALLASLPRLVLLGRRPRGNRSVDHGEAESRDVCGNILPSDNEGDRA
jgi:hypothetical protein